MLIYRLDENKSLHVEKKDQIIFHRIVVNPAGQIARLNLLGLRLCAQKEKGLGCFDCFSI